MLYKTKQFDDDDEMENSLNEIRGAGDGIGFERKNAQNVSDHI